jgi:hypothetical protein
MTIQYIVVSCFVIGHLDMKLTLNKYLKIVGTLAEQSTQNFKFESSNPAVGTRGGK